MYSLPSEDWTTIQSLQKYPLILMLQTPRSNVTRMCEISESAGKIKANCIQRSAD